MKIYGAMEKARFIKKHCESCDCCPHHSQLKCNYECQKCDQFLKGHKGTGYSEKFGKVTKDLWGTGTSRCSNGLKSGPQLPCQLRLMKI